MNEPTNNGAPVTTMTAPQPRPLIELPETDGRSIDAFASEAHFVSAQRMAKALAHSSMVPEQYRTTYFEDGTVDQDGVPNVLIALEMAHRIGASIFAVMQSLHTVQGRPGWASTFLIATVNASKLFTPLRYRFEGKPGTDEWGCRAWAKDRESGEECPGTLITMAMAKSEGWSAKSGSKWRTMPEQMLCYRAAAFWTRIYCPEMALGMHTAEEIHDIEPQVMSLSKAKRAVVGEALTSAIDAALAPTEEPKAESAERLPPSDVNGDP